ncbi:PAP2 family protein [Aphelenchoides fujianensis]|nr:PAP2 family protein [Aphelenchoides fujianensis]
MVFICARYMVGRIRPNFIEMCKPSVGYLDCPTLQFITNYTCTSGKSWELVQSQRQSFFSGHASISAAISTWSIMYVQHRLKPHLQSTFSVVPWIQTIFVLICAWMSFTRVSDYHHHFSDVLVGLVVGIIAPIIVVS